MSKYFALANAPHRSHRGTSISYALSGSKSHLTLLAATIAMSLSFLMVVLLSMHTMAKTGYQIQQLQTQARALQEQQETLTVALSQAQSIASISERLPNLHFEKITSVTYLASEGHTLAYGQDTQAR